jgi:uncharacterized protein (TIGR03067 family)
MYSKRLVALALLGLIFALAVSSQGLAQQPKADKDALKEKSWTVTKAEENGKQQDELMKAKFTFKDDKLTLKLVAEKDPVELSYKLDEKKKTIDIQPADTKEPAQGIYEIEGDKLKLTVMDPGGQRPMKMGQAGKGIVYIELTKDK